MGGGAWPAFVLGVVCLVDSDNVRDQRGSLALGSLATAGAIQPDNLR